MIKSFAFHINWNPISEYSIPVTRSYHNFPTTKHMQEISSNASGCRKGECTITERHSPFRNVRGAPLLLLTEAEMMPPGAKKGRV